MTEAYPTHSNTLPGPCCVKNSELILRLIDGGGNVSTACNSSTGHPEHESLSYDLFGQFASQISMTFAGVDVYKPPSGLVLSSQVYRIIASESFFVSLPAAWKGDLSTPPRNLHRNEVFFDKRWAESIRKYLESIVFSPLAIDSAEAVWIQKWIALLILRRN